MGFKKVTGQKRHLFYLSLYIAGTNKLNTTINWQQNL